MYVSENCFGFQGQWSDRPGWQQIADCVSDSYRFRTTVYLPTLLIVGGKISDLTWAQGGFMSLSEPVVPPFPVSDYGTGCIGAIAALLGLYYLPYDTRRIMAWQDVAIVL